MTKKTQFHTSIITKIASLLLIISFIFSLAGISAIASEGHLVTLLIIPDKTVSYTNYDSAYLKLMNTGTGEITNYTLYPYNNFSNKVLLETGEYAVIDVGINGRNDIIFEVEKTQRIKIDASKAIVVHLHDSGIIKPTETTTKHIETTTLTADPSNSSTTQNNPTGTSETTTTTHNVPTITFPDNTENTSDALTNPNGDPITRLPTTNPNIPDIPDEPNDSSDSNKFTIVIFVVLGILSLIIIIFFILVYKKNKAE